MVDSNQQYLLRQLSSGILCSVVCWMY